MHPKGGGSTVPHLSDQLLIYSYQQAQKYHLNLEFIQLLEREIRKRALESIKLSS
ncbi:sporulation histidine kinase inhibitor Sda [Sporosarcina sp. P19]|nr:sporulation histidine kinase inhibitor Sda [Sporosarcina sp. P19]